MSNKEGTPTPEEAFAKVLKERRLALGLTQTDLEADDVMDRSYISKLELGKRQVCLRGILHLAEALRMSPGELMDAVASQMRPLR
jgi:transcriptional regulator with XRE-family HTH domain